MSEPAAPRDFTSDELETIVVNALKARDFQAVESALLVMATKDPRRAEGLMDTMLLGVALKKAERRSGE